MGQGKRNQKKPRQSSRNGTASPRSARWNSRTPEVKALRSRLNRLELAERRDACEQFKGSDAHGPDVGSHGEARLTMQEMTRNAPQAPVQWPARAPSTSQDSFEEIQRCRTRWCQQTPSHAPCREWRDRSRSPQIRTNTQAVGAPCKRRCHPRMSASHSRASHLDV